MAQNMRFNSAVFSSVILLCCAVLALALGVPMLSDPMEIWWIGLLLIVCALFVGFNAINIFRSAQKEKKIYDEQMTSIDFQKNETKDKAKVQILASWIYSVSEWKQFLKWEKKKRGNTIITEAIVLMFLGMLAIHYLTRVDWKMAVTISVAIGVVYSFIKYFIAFNSIQPDENKMPEVIITNEAVMINGRTNRFYGDDLWLGKVLVNDAGSFNILEITYCLHTRKGKTYDEIRVPIPKGSLKEAIFLQEKLMQEKKLIESH